MLNSNIKINTHACLSKGLFSIFTDFHVVRQPLDGAVLTEPPSAFSHMRSLHLPITRRLTS